MAAYREVLTMRDDPLPAKAVHEGTVFRVVYIVLGLSVIIGLALDKVIPYTPVFPLVVLAASLVCCTAAVRAGRYTRLLPDPREYVGGFLFTAFVGSVLDLLFSGIATIMAALPVSGGAVSGGSRAVLLNLSWPAVVISVLAMALAIRVTRRTRGDEGR
jgi:hypothetical protein